MRSPVFHLLCRAYRTPSHLTYHQEKAREELEMELLFWPGAVTATGPGCHRPQNKGKCVVRRVGAREAQDVSWVTLSVGLGRPGLVLRGSRAQAPR
ncbi:hypothetical protein Cadr_000000566 [Camelus dromedarius]|uniref:Uncharacterized protein n=1 Tax=Camelus dromedarius TaxID=9838 RepID=A0A5N4EI08_CAMDR|nr:hypothetical protein Cadr_000000566 [Camelus dromedarius]